MKLADWVIETAALPIAFAQVREDASLDQWVVRQLAPDVKVLMVASGGCSASALATMPQVSRLHVVDPNPAQIALTRLKLRLLSTAKPAERLALLGHAPMSPAKRARLLTRELMHLRLGPDALGPMHLVAKAGPDYAGRYEILFSELRRSLAGVADEIAELLQLRDPVEQSNRCRPSTVLGRALDEAFDSLMALPILIKLFGKGATRNRREPFARHFARRTRRVLATLPAADNPYLWQMLRGRFPSGIFYPWLDAPVPTRLPELEWTVTGMAEALRSWPGQFDFIHLSNILDWLAPETARATLDLAWRALRPGGWAFLRQLNSSLDIEALGGRFAWQTRPAEALFRRDRSFFYRGLHLGIKR